MSKTRLKIVLWLILGVTAVALVLGTITSAARLIAYFQAGADPASALHIVPNVPPDLQVALAWLPDDADTGRQMEPLTRAQIESAYLRAWFQWNISYLRGEPYGLETYFVGPALAAADEAVLAARQQGFSLAQTDLSHQLQLHFYAADGSIVSLTAHDVLVAQIIRDAAGAPIFSGVTQADYAVVMMLEDGNWRVRHWVRRRAVPLAAGTQAADVPADFARVVGKQLVVGERPFPLRGVNYYPQASPWLAFWPAYNPAIIEQDLGRIEALGLNTVRIFVPYPLPAAAPLADGQPADVDSEALFRQNLADFLDRAESHHLKVIVTLFDFRTDYQILLWPNADRALEAVVPYFAHHPAILAWDLKNEPDLDQPGNTPEMVNAWLAHIAWQVRRLDANHLITIGWSQSEAAAQLAEAVDFVSFHAYGPPADLPEKYAQLRTAVPHKPIVLTEFGLSTWNSAWFPGGHTEQEQAVYFAAMRQALAETDAAGYVAWTLYDFAGVPSNVAGRAPWRTGPQKYLGILNADGTSKPAARLVGETSDWGVKRPFFLARFLQPFWRTIWVVLGVCFLGGVWLRRRKHAPKPDAPPSDSIR